jgi:hypothetical protein
MFERIKQGFLFGFGFTCAMLALSFGASYLFTRLPSPGSKGEEIEKRMSDL